MDFLVSGAGTYSSSTKKKKRSINIDELTELRRVVNKNMYISTLYLYVSLFLTAIEYLGYLSQSFIWLLGDNFPIQKINEVPILGETNFVNITFLLGFVILDLYLLSISLESFRQSLITKKLVLDASKVNKKAEERHG